MGQPVTLYDETSLRNQSELQRGHAWDLERSIAWDTRLDLSKPLVPMDEHAILFPGASDEQRLAISQFMGLIISASISEMEECLLRLRDHCWRKLYEDHPVSPEFVDLGDLFFEEEMKHSSAFRRYNDKFSEVTGIDPQTLHQLLPIIERSHSEKILKYNLKRGGQSFWWIVAAVEQEFLRLYKSLQPAQKKLEPLYYDLHKKHFEEEARHSPFPYLVLELLITRQEGFLHKFHVRSDLALAQFLQTLWTVSSLTKVKAVRRVSKEHPFFGVLASCLPLLEKQPPTRILWQMLTSTPYVSSLVNPGSHHKILRAAHEHGAVNLPFPEYNPKKSVA